MDLVVSRILSFVNNESLYRDLLENKDSQITNTWESQETNLFDLYSIVASTKTGLTYSVE